MITGKKSSKETWGWILVIVGILFSLITVLVLIIDITTPISPSKTIPPSYNDAQKIGYYIGSYFAIIALLFVPLLIGAVSLFFGIRWVKSNSQIEPIVIQEVNEKSTSIWSWVLPVVGLLLVTLGIFGVAFLSGHATKNVLLSYVACSIPTLVLGGAFVALGARWIMHGDNRKPTVGLSCGGLVILALGSVILLLLLSRV